MEHGEPLVVVIPAFNEAERLGQVIRETRAALPSARVVVVDDASTDGTATVAREAGATVLRHSINLGYGTSLQTRFKYALRCRATLIAQLDGDGQHDPRSLPAMVEEVRRGECDVVVGSRFLSKGSYQGPWLKRLGSRLLSRVASLVMKMRVTDTTSGLLVMNHRAFRICTRDLYPTDFPDADTLIMLQREGLRLREMPVVFNPSTRPSTLHRGFHPLYYIYKMSLSILVTLLRGRRR